MSKPELTVWIPGRLAIDGSRCYRNGKIREDMADRIAEEKHFTDAELAAEYWRATSGEGEMHYGRQSALHPAWILHRFAVAPHALEAPNGR